MSTDPNAHQTIVIQQKESMFGRFGKLLIGVVVILIMALFGMSAAYSSYFSDPNGPQEKYHSLAKMAMDKIAIIEVAGTIVEGDEFPKDQIDLIKKDESVKAVVLRINSPGGTVTQSDYLLHHLREMKKERDIPIVVSMGSLCASGGYYIAMAVGEQEDAIFAEPTTWTGSIGVIIPHYNVAELMDTWGVEEDAVASGEFKQMGTPTRKMTEEERALFQELVDQTYQHFRDVVKSGRPAFQDDDDALDAVAKGQIFTANQALENGLVDKIGFIEDAVARAAELASLSTDNVRCVQYKAKVTALDALMGAQSARSSGGRLSELRALFDLTSPRAYYLYTTLPTLLQAK